MDSMWLVNNRIQHTKLIFMDSMVSKQSYSINTLYSYSWIAGLVNNRIQHTKLIFMDSMWLVNNRIQHTKLIFMNSTVSKQYYSTHLTHIHG